jgi:hypothetical protein
MLVIMISCSMISHMPKALPRKQLTPEGLVLWEGLPPFLHPVPCHAQAILCILHCALCLLCCTLCLLRRLLCCKLLRRTNSCCSSQLNNGGSRPFPGPVSPKSHQLLCLLCLLLRQLSSQLSAGALRGFQPDLQLLRCGGQLLLCALQLLRCAEHLRSQSMRPAIPLGLPGLWLCLCLQHG